MSNGMASAAGSIGSAIVSGLFANAAAHKSYKFSSKLMNQQAKLNYNYSLKSAENMPSATREGLESGGYNPMLAVQNATNGANSSWTSQANGPTPDYGSAVSNAFDFKRLENETEQSESVTDANYANADKAKAEKAEISARLPFVPKHQKAEIAKLEADAQLAEAQKHNLKERLELDRYINDTGLATTRRGQDKVYNASTFSSTLSHPFARFGHKSWKSVSSWNSGSLGSGQMSRSNVPAYVRNAGF